MHNVNRRHFLGASLTAGAALTLSAQASAADGFFDFSTPSMPSHDRLRDIARQELERNNHRFAFTDRVGIADFSPYSSTPRFYLVNMEDGRVDQFHVTHGRGSDPGHLGWLQNFSNQMGSNCTSRGAYLTQDLYYGQHGLSMRLQGLDYDNFMAMDRAIVVHGAWYAEPDMIARYGKLGRSEGCFAFAQADLSVILDRLGPGRLLFADRV